MEKDEIKNQIRNYFEKAYGRKLSAAEVTEIILNISGLFKLLYDFSQKDKEEQKETNK